MTPEELIKYYEGQLCNAEIQIKCWQAMREEALEAIERVKKSNIAPVVIGS
jgi:hypothetical protein